MVILSAMIPFLSLRADAPDAPRFPLNAKKAQLAQELSQPVDDPANEGNLEVTSNRLVPGKALLLSAILPGTGQLYGKNPLMAGVFFAIEVGAWTGVALYHSQGMQKEDDYKKYANDYWTYYDGAYSGDFGSYLDYEYWAAAVMGPYGDGTGELFPGNITEWQEETWQNKLKYLPQDGFTHELDPEDKDQQYYEMIGKYNQFGAGWPAAGDAIADYRTTTHTNWRWETNNSYRENYLNLRKDSNDALDMSKNFTMVVLANHLISALHAGFNVSWHNRKLAKEQKVEGSFHLEPKQINNEQLTMATLRVQF
jgi:hypothetical protein